LHLTIATRDLGNWLNLKMVLYLEDLASPKTGLNVVQTACNARTLDAIPLKLHTMGEIFKDENFKSLKNLENNNLDFFGLYALKIKDSTVLPKQLKEEIENQDLTIIYIGKAERKSLKNRLEEECRGKRHGTFFRGIGALLGLKPPKGSLIGKSNTNNYKFSQSDSIKIVEWMNENLMFDYLKAENNIDFVERDLIKHFQPILNTTHNPKKSKYLAMRRKECRNVALQ